MGLIREWYRGEACAAPTALSILFCFEYPGLTAWANLCRTYGAWRSDNARPDLPLCRTYGARREGLNRSVILILVDLLLNPRARVQSNSAGLGEVASSPGRSANCGMIYRPLGCLQGLHVF